MYKVRRGGKVTYIGAAAWNQQAGGGAGGAGGGAGNAQAQQNQQNAQNPQNQQAIPTPNGRGTAAFTSLTKDQQDAIIRQVATHSIDPKLPQTELQKFADLAGIDRAPDMVNSDDFDKIPGKAIYRVTYAPNAQAADDIVADIMFNDTTWYSDSGGSAHGRGIYFGDNMQSLTSSYSRDSNATIIRAKLNQNARPISYPEARRKADAASGALRTITDPRDRAAIWAIQNGYNVMTDYGMGQNIDVVLSREAVTVDYTYHKITASERSNPPSSWDRFKR